MRLIQIQKNVLKQCFRLYCVDKPIKTLDNIQNVNKKSEIIQETAEITAEEASAKFEERLLKQVLIEKEQDANFQSRMSKDCKIIFGGAPNKATSIKCGAIRLDQITIQKDSPEWVSCNLDILQASGSEDYSKKQLLLTTETTTKTPSKLKEEGVKSAPNNSTRPLRQPPGKVLLAFIPQEWWSNFIPKTGVTGFGTFLFTFVTFLVSKEYYVLEHEYYSGISMFIIWATSIKYFGPKVAQWVDQHLDAFEKSWNKGREQHKQMLNESIMEELHLQFQMEGERLLYDVKRENVHLQLEEEYRKRQMYAYEQVKKRLEYQVAVEQIRQRIQHRNLIEYVTKEVIKSITPEVQDKLIYYSIDQIIKDLEADKNKK